MIYFVQPAKGGPIKIGTTEDFKTRFQALQAYYGKRFAILRLMPGGPVEEREIQDRFDHLRIGITEQFRPGPDLMTFIGRPLLAHPNPRPLKAMLGGQHIQHEIVTLHGAIVEWLNDIAPRVIDAASIIRDAIAAWAKVKGFQPSPEI